MAIVSHEKISKHKERIVLVLPNNIRLIDIVMVVKNDYSLRAAKHIKICIHISVIKVTQQHTHIREICMECDFEIKSQNSASRNKVSK